MDIQDYLKIINDLYNGIKNSENGNFFLDDYSKIKHSNLNTVRVAKNRLVSDHYRKSIINRIYDMKLDIYILGTLVLHSVYKKSRIPNNNICFAIRKITEKKIRELEKILKNIFKRFQCLVIRTSQIVTWIFFDRERFVYEAELLLFDFKSFSEILIIEPVDVRCIGYSIKSDKFCYLKNYPSKLLSKSKSRPLCAKLRYNWSVNF